MKNKPLCFIPLALFFNSYFLFATPRQITLTGKNLPEIKQLNSKDILYKQYAQEVESNYKQTAKGQLTLPNFYIYHAHSGDTIFTIAASCSIPYDTLATINSIPDSTIDFNDKKILLPTAAGLFICSVPATDIEILLQKQYDTLENSSEDLYYELSGKHFVFLPEERFTPTIRAYFLDSTIKLPVGHAAISSPYGMRISPITGKRKFHHGIDFAVPVGTPVLACKNGKVSLCRKNDHVYGNYVVIKHDNGMTSIYAHLSVIMVKKDQIVKGGTEIGLSGSTGESTGPHLHFEIRKRGTSVDPENILQL